MRRTMGSGSSIFSPSRLGRSTVALLATICGCGPVAQVDDQRIASEEDRAAVNPTPAPRDFRGQNDRHRVLVAAIDTGVDYDHPLLSQNVHFSLDEDGEPVGLGRDFIGDDPWPAPYLARTSRYDERLDPAARAASVIAWENARRLVRAHPDVARFFEPARNLGAEKASRVEHGTHVAGLMVYDRPDIGLLAYRVLPHNRHVGKDQEPEHDHDADLVARIDAAVTAAVGDGARVVNMSLGGDTDADNPERHKKLEAWSAALRKTVLRYPRVLFVVAAGNAAHWLDGATRTAFPCGIDASNMLCVGALRESGDPTSFSNLPLSGVDVIFALGENVLSTVPTKICPVMAEGVLQRPDVTDESLKRLAAEAREKCGKAWFLKKLSGTSMAAPLASHLAAEILAELPELPAADVIREMQHRSLHTFIGNQAVYKIRIKKPSWYALEPAMPPAEDPNRLRALEPNGDAGGELAYWEAYLPVSRDGAR